MILSLIRIRLCIFNRQLRIITISASHKRKHSSVTFMRHRSSKLYKNKIIINSVIFSLQISFDNLNFAWLLFIRETYVVRHRVLLHGFSAWILRDILLCVYCFSGLLLKICLGKCFATVSFTRNLELIFPLLTSTQ